MPPSVFDPILGQPAAVQTLEKALRCGRVHHAYRFEGPSGVGKERTALAFAQSLLCPHAAPQGCGTCSTCRRVMTFSAEAPLVPQHPDVVLVGRGVYPPPILTSREATGISVEQIRKVVLTRAGYPPHENRALVVLVRDAEELTISAANALLKTLEEPSPGTHFVLLTSRPQRLLDTIRSRTLAVRFGPLPEEVLESLLRARNLDTAFVALAEGSMERALELADGETAALSRRWIEQVEEALAAPDLSAALTLAAQLPKARGQVQRRLQVYAQHLARVARTGNAEAFEREHLFHAECYSRVQFALTCLERNVTPALVVESLLVEMRAARL